MPAEDIYDINMRLTTHEAVCAERYGALKSRVSRIEALGWAILTSCGVSMMSALGFLLWYAITHPAK